MNINIFHNELPLAMDLFCFISVWFGLFYDILFIYFCLFGGFERRFFLNDIIILIEHTFYL